MKTKSLYPYIITDKYEETVRFYVDSLGFQIKHDHVREGDGGHIAVLTNEAGCDMEVMERPACGPEKLGTIDFGLRMNVDDLEAACRELQEKGCRMEDAIQDIPLGKIAVVIDPSGTSITLIQHIRKP